MELSVVYCSLISFGEVLKCIQGLGSHCYMNVCHSLYNIL
jgi:hypothetical protein